MISQKALQDILKNLEKQEGVKGVVITNIEGLPISSNMSTEVTESISAHITSLVGKARSVAKGMGYKEDDLKFMLLDLGEDEVLVTPAKDYMLIVLRKKM